MTGVRLPLCDSCLHLASTHREQLMRHLRQTSKRLRASRASLQNTVDAARRSMGGSAQMPTLPASVTATATADEPPGSRANSGSQSGSDRIAVSLATNKEELLRRLERLRAEQSQLRRRQARAVARRQRATSATAVLRAACDGVEARVSVAQRRLLAYRAFALRFRQQAWTARFRYERLRRSSLLNEAFAVTSHGPFVVINGCRLGRLPGEVVPWAEINAALGHTALLVASLAKRMGVVLSRHRIIPMGSFTRICPHGGNERSATPLHYDGGFFANSRLNTSIKALGQCVLELQKRVAPSLPLPYPVSSSGETAGGASILLTLGTREPEWTAAVRNLLTTLKWIQVWALAHTSPQRLDV